MDPTDEQRAIADFVAAGEGNLVVEALAGSGKSTALLHALERLPQRSALLCAFNRSIADELKARLPKMPRTHAIHVQTFHGQGLAMLKAQYRHLQIDKSATEALINKAAGQSISFKMRRAAVRLLRTLKETYAEPAIPTSPHVLALGLEYDYLTNMTDRESGLTVEVVRDAYALSLNIMERETIDFCDMVWAPVALNIKPKTRYLAIFVDELQDISRPQFAMLRMLMAPNSRFIGVGDLRQQIYNWRGSMGSAAWRICEDELNASKLPLTMTWRCSSAVVKEANAIVPELRARDNAAPGSIIDTTRAEMPELLKLPIATDAEVHTFVLSRNNTSLLDCALYLWRERVRFELNAGKELLEPLFTLLDTKLDLRDVTLFRKSLEEWKMKELARAEAAHAAAYADRIEEQAAMLMVASTFAKPDQIRKLLSDILLPNTSGVLLSTVHKVKGLEAERVFLLKQTFARHAPCRACKGEGFDGNCRLCGGTGYAEPEQEEKNIEYVAITRAKTQIVWVDMKRDDSEQRLAKAGA